MSSENGPQISENFLDAARADAQAKYDVYREAYSAWWNAIQVVKHLTDEASARG